MTNGTPIRKPRVTHIQTERPVTIHAVQTEKPQMTHVQRQILDMTHFKTDRPKMTHEHDIEAMQCVMCLKDVEGGEDHNCAFKCPNCNEHSCIHFAYLINYRDKVLENSEKKCLDCDDVCTNKVALISHVNQRHLHYRPYKCDICGQSYHSKAAVRNHISSHKYLIDHSVQKNTESCAVCEEILMKKDMKRHMELHSTRYPCEICNLEYDSLRKLRAHSRKHDGPFLTCHVCGKEVRETVLKTHLESHCVVSCNLCDISFENITLLKYHQKSHLDDAQCPKCDKMINPAKLRRHLKSHSDSPELKELKKQKANITCDLCGYITWNSILLERHMNRYHLKIKPYVCHICSKDFIGKHLLKKHLKSHTVDQSVICAVCGKKLANNTCLKSHLKLHTGEKNYPCNICGERFRSASIMNVHKVKKHTEREVACPLCPSMFYTLVELRRHIIKIHWKRDTKFDPRELEGLENHYHLFHDGRRIRMDEEDVDFYLPC